MKGKTDSSGFTLLELLIASTLVIIFITGIVQAVTLSLNVYRRCLSRNAAANAAVSALERLKSRPFDHPSLAEQAWNDQIDTPLLPVAISRKCRITDVSASLKRIDIECRIPDWKSYPVKLTVIISKELGF
jgi:Tfp pilus assembly protein PilV